MKRKIFVALLFCTISISSFAQSEVEGLRFSRTFQIGTARFSSMGGAFTALGGDLTTLAFNPAGIGVYRTGEFTISPNLTHTKTTSSYMGNSAMDTRYQFGLSNVGAVGVIAIGNGEDGLVSINIGVNYNKYNNFSERIAVQGSAQSADRSYLSYFSSKANLDPQGKDYEADMAWQTNLISFDSIGNVFHPNLNNGDNTVDSRSGEIWGNIGEYDFSVGGNVANIFYFGATLGVARATYYENLDDVEEGLPNNTSDFAGMTYSKAFRMSGTGYNFKAGVIARPFINADFLTGLRLGLAIHTPTFWSMSDNYSAQIESAFINPGQAFYANTDFNAYDYEIQTPLKFMGGVAYSFGAQGSDWKGVASADYEYVNYSQIKMRNGSDGYNFKQENRNIEKGYVAVSNIRLGGEVQYQQFALRGGFAYYGDPYQSQVNKDGAAYVYSGGIGIRGKAAYLDFAYSLMTQNDKSYMYNSTSTNQPEYNVVSDEISYKIRQSNFILTLGLKF